MDKNKHPKRKAHDLNLDGVAENEQSEDGINFSDLPDELPELNNENQSSDPKDANQYGMDLGDLENEGRNEYDLDVDRMINEGMAGGYVRGDRNQITQSHSIQENDQPFDTPKEEE